jgi:hypothetical protein
LGEGSREVVITPMHLMRAIRKTDLQDSKHCPDGTECQKLGRASVDKRPCLEWSLATAVLRYRVGDVTEYNIPHSTIRSDINSSAFGPNSAIHIERTKLHGAVSAILTAK